MFIRNQLRSYTVTVKNNARIFIYIYAPLQYKICQLYLFYLCILLLKIFIFEELEKYQL